MEQIQLGKQDICFCGAGEAEDWGFRLATLLHPFLPSHFTRL